MFVLALKIGVLITSAVGTVLVCEAALRAAGMPHQDIAYRRAQAAGFALFEPNQDLLAPWGDRVRINSVGLRGDEPVADRCWTALLLGDSFTFIDHYPLHLKELVRTRFGGAHDVINAGYHGQTIDHEWVVWREQGRSLEPDVVVLQFFVNDIEDLRTRPSDRQPAPTAVHNYLRQTATFHLVQRARAAAVDFARTATMVREPEGWWHTANPFYSQPLPPLIQRTWDRYFRLLDRLAADVRQTGARFLIVVVPDREQVVRPEWEPVPQQLMASFAEWRGIPLVDPLDIFRRHEQEGRSVYEPPEIDFHLNDRGGQVLATEVYAALLSRRWVGGC